MAEPILILSLIKNIKYTSKPVSRVLSWTAIYLGVLSPDTLWIPFGISCDTT